MIINPLSPWNYFKNNKKRAIPVVASIILAITFTYMGLIIFNSAFMSEDIVVLNKYKTYSLITPKNEGDKLSDSLINDLENDISTEKLIPINSQYTYYYNVLGGNMFAYVYTMKKDDVKFMMDRLNLKLKSGRLPETSEEIVLDYRLAANKSLKLGDKIGNEIDKKEVLIGNYKIVGLIEGNSMVSFSITDEKYQNLNLNSNVILIHKPENLKESNDSLKKLSEKFTSAKFTTFTRVKTEIDKDDALGRTIINLIEFILLLVITLTVGNSTYVHFYQRKKEFGILYAVGYSRKEVIKKIFNELLFLNILSSILGLLMAFILMLILSILIFEPKGIPLKLVDIKTILQCLIIPIFIFIFSLVPISRMLKKLDFLEIIEGSH